MYVEEKKIAGRAPSWHAVTTLSMLSTGTTEQEQYIDQYQTM